MTAAFTDPAPQGVAGPKPPPTVLRGPEHADNYRIKVGRYGDRWYRDPLPADRIAPADGDTTSYPSVSIVKGASGKDWTYVALKRVAHSDDLADIASKGYYERYERLKVVNALDLSAAMRRGTNVHTWAECRAYGIDPYLVQTDDGSDYFPIVDKLFAELQPELVAAEVVAIHRSMNGVGYGGTSDGIFRIHGKTYMVDWKSRGDDSQHAGYPEEAAQLAAYYGAEYMIVADDDRANVHGAKRIAVPQLDGALIVSIKPDSYEVYPVDLERSVAHFEAMHGWWCSRRSESKTVAPKWPPRRAAVADPECIHGLGPASACTICNGREAAETSMAETVAATTTFQPDGRREAMYARVDKLTAAQRIELGEQLMNVDINDLDEVERVLNDVEVAPSMNELAQRRMARDAEREADRHLSAEGGPAAADDVQLFELTWDMGLNNAGRRWVTQVVNEAIEARVDFRFSALESQRRCDLFCALTEYATVDEFDENNDRPFRLMLDQIGTYPDLHSAPLGKLIGSLGMEQAAALRLLISEKAWRESP